MSLRDEYIPKDDENQEKADAATQQNGWVMFNGKKTYLKWGWVSEEWDELQLTKAAWRIMGHIMRRAGPPDFMCYAGIRKISDVTRTHPVTVKRTIRYLERRELITRLKRHGRASILRMVDKLWWLRKHGASAAQAGTLPIEETEQDVKDMILWDRIWAIMPHIPKLRWQKRIAENRLLFEAALAETEQRCKRGLGAAGGRYRADALKPVTDVVAVFEWNYQKLKDSNP